MAPEVLVAGAVLVAAVGVGALAHEGTHVLALWALGVSCELVVLPDRADASASGRLGATVPGRWATVTPTGGLDRLSPWRLRVAALAPLALLAPFGPVGLGVLPDPFAASPVAVAAAVGWAACALPSPQDFALVWYPERALAAHRD